jgi:hypothetical protein
MDGGVYPQLSGLGLGITIGLALGLVLMSMVGPMALVIGAAVGAFLGVVIDLNTEREDPGSSEPTLCQERLRRQTSTLRMAAYVPQAR